MFLNVIIDQSCVNVKKRKIFMFTLFLNNILQQQKKKLHIIQIEQKNGYYTIPLNTYYNHTSCNINH